MHTIGEPDSSNRGCGNARNPSRPAVEPLPHSLPVYWSRHLTLLQYRPENRRRPHSHADGIDLAGSSSRPRFVIRSSPVSVLLSSRSRRRRCITVAEPTIARQGCGAHFRDRTGILISLSESELTSLLGSRSKIVAAGLSRRINLVP